MMAVYHGREPLGILRGHGPHDVEAIMPSGKSLGRFPNRKAAMAALPTPNSARAGEGDPSPSSAKHEMFEVQR